MLTTFALTILAYAPQGGPPSSRLAIGVAVDGELSATAPPIQTETLTEIHPDAPVRGVTYGLRVPKDGIYAIELRSSLFDAYLVLRDDTGEVLAEDDDGLLASHSRIVATLKADRPYTIQACALHEENGAFRIVVNAGEPQPIPPTARRALELEEARQALRAREERFGADHPALLYSLRELATKHEGAGQFHEAVPPLRRVIAILEKVHGPGHHEVGAAANALAVILNKARRLEEAEPLYRLALAIFEKAIGPEQPETATVVFNLGNLLVAQGRYEEAEPLLLRSLKTAEKVLGPDHIEVAMNLTGLSNLRLEQRRYRDAETLSRRSLAITEASVGGDDPLLATTLSYLATALEQQGKDAEAETLTRRALGINEKALGPEHPFTLAVVNNLAGTLMRLRRYTDAEPLYRRLLTVGEKSLGPENPSVATYLANLARLLCQQGRYSEARPLYDRALAIHEVAHGRHHPNTADALNHVALLEVDSGRPDAAWAHLERSVSSRHDHLRQLFAAGAGEADRLRYIRRTRASLRLMFNLAVSGDNDTWRTQAYEALLASKGQVFRSTARLREGLFAALGPAQKRTLEELQAVQAELSGTVSARHIADVDRHREALAALVERRDALEAELVRSFARTDRDRSLRLADVAARLPRNSVLIDLHVRRPYRPARFADGKCVEPGDWQPERVSAWIVHPGSTSVTHVDLGVAAELEAEVNKFLQHTTAQRGLTPKEPAQPRSALRRQLWDPLQEEVGDAELVIVSPDTFLATLPFETLPEPDGSFLIEKHAFVYLQDAASLVHGPTEAARAAPNLVAAGAIDYDARPDVAEAAETMKAPATAHRAPSFTTAWNPLSETRREVDAIERLHKMAFDDAATRRVLRDEAATEEQIKRSLTGAGVVHLATHGFFRPDDSRSNRLDTDLPGLRSGLVCAGANLTREPERDDGLLTAEEVAWIDLSACDLVVLSACQTGLGQAHGGEGLMSLRRAFRQAGARAVVSSLWKVRDDATRDLMVDFYERMWRRGATPLAALRGAQLAMLARNRDRYGQPLPSTWGSFVLSGDWR